MAKITKKHENGFTLIEILLISVIVLLIAVSITMIFTGGRRSWTSADKGSETIQNAVIGMEKLVREIKNSPGLTYFNTSEIRFAVLRKDDGDLDGDGNTTEYVTKYARTKRDGSYLKYGERDTDSDTNGDWTLSNLAYPVTNLSFSFKKLDGSDAIPGTDDVADVKSVLINMTTSEDGVTIPLNSRAYLVMETFNAMNFDGTPDSPGEPGPDDHHFNEGDEETDSPPPGSEGDGVGGWGLTDYVIYGDKEVSISNNCTINGNVGTRSGNGVTYTGVAYDSQNNTDINGYLIIKGAFNMVNSSIVNDDSVLAACGVKSSYDACSSVFANNCQINGNFWTLKNIDMSNSSWINGTVYKPASANITLYNTAKYNEPPSPIDIEERVPSDDTYRYRFMFDPLDGQPDGTPVVVGKSVFPTMPPAQSSGFAGTTPDVKINKDSLTIYEGAYDEIVISNSALLTMVSGTYYINSFIMKNSSRVRFDFINNGPIWIYVKTSVNLTNSASFEYLNNGIASADPKFGADLLYIEPQTGMTCENSVQWKGFIYAPNGDVSFANGTGLAGAVYSARKVDISNHITATYVPPAFDYDDDADGRHAILLPAKFYPQGYGD